MLRTLALTAFALALSGAPSRADGVNLVTCILDVDGATGPTVSCPVALVAGQDYLARFFTDDPVTGVLLDPQGNVALSFVPPPENTTFAEYRASVSGTYTVRLDDKVGAGSRDAGALYVDTDCRADALTRCSIAPGQRRQGANRPLEEDDRYATGLVAGGVYAFALTAPPGGRVTLLNAAGSGLATASVPRGRTGALLRWRATRGGPYAVRVSSSARYTLAMRR